MKPGEAFEISNTKAEPLFVTYGFTTITLPVGQSAVFTAEVSTMGKALIAFLQTKGLPMDQDLLAAIEEFFSEWKQTLRIR